MKRILIVALLSLTGCATTPPPTRPSVTSSNSKVVTTSDGHTTRTEEYARNSHSDAQGETANTHQAARQTNADGSVSQHSSDLHTAAGAGVDVAEDAHHVTFSGSNVSRELTVADKDVAVSENGSHLTLSGQTHGLSVTGNDNHIQVDVAQTILVTGSGNEVLYGGSPSVQDKGKANRVQSR